MCIRDSSKSDYKIGKYVNKIAKLIAEGICNKKLGIATKAKESVKTTVKKVTKATVYAKVVTKSDPLMIRQSANVSSKIIGKITVSYTHLDGDIEIQTQFESGAV